jgi:predicted ribosomally synthesized peptide with SipW-like signal peptide
MTLRKAAGLLIAAGLMIGLIGAGVSATFTDSATAVANISVGTFGIQVTSSTANAVVDSSSGQLGGWTHSVTLACPTIQSSAAGSCPLEFTVTNKGSMPATIVITAAVSGGDAQFSAIPVTATSPLAASAATDYNGGIQWSALSNGDLGANASVTYTITATN